MRYIVLLALLSACTTSQTVLRGPNGTLAICGGSSVGSLSGGVIGYHIQKGMDEDCTNELMSKGYKIVQ